MSKRSNPNRRRVLFAAARSRRIAPTFPLILAGLLGLSDLRVLPVSPTSPILTDLCAASRLYAQTPAQFNAAPTARRFANASQLPQTAQTAANATQNPAQNQVVFFSIPVAADAAVVRSGPSEDAYPTGSVGKNRYVEAYFRSDDGWCAIRPPQGSFSWVNAKFVRRETDSTGRIVSTGNKAVPARVGGATVEESALVQVGLKNGTTVKILDETRLSDGSSWLKIAPPSGEFRWIRAKDLIADPAIAQLPTKLTFQREFLEQLARTPNGEATDVAAAPSPTALSAAASPVNSAQTPQSAAVDASTPVSEESATRFKMELARLNADVFQTLRQNPPSDAELALLASRAETLFDAAPSDGERFVVQSIYDAIKIAERRNRAQFGGASTPGALPNSPNAPVFPNSPQSSTINGGDRFGDFQVEGDAPLLVLPESSFEPSDARSGAAFLNGSNDAYFPQTAQTVNPNDRIDVSQFFPPSENGYSSNGLGANDGAQGEKRPRLAFAFSNANTPFRSRSSKGKEVRLAPVAPQNGSRAAGVSKLPSLLPTQKQLIIPPPNYRSTPLGQSGRGNARLVAAAQTPGNKAEKTEKMDAPSQTSEAPQDLTVDSVRWRAVDQTATVPVAESDAKIASAEATVPADSDKIGQAAPIGSTAAPKAPASVGATVPKIKKSAAASPAKKFQPVSSPSSTAFDAAGVLARLPKAPQGTPQYALTRRIDDNRFEIVSYLEAENGVSLEPYVGRDVGVKGTLGTIQIGEKAQKLTTVQTVFERD